MPARLDQYVKDPIYGRDLFVPELSTIDYWPVLKLPDIRWSSWDAVLKDDGSECSVPNRVVAAGASNAGLVRGYVTFDWFLMLV